MLLSISEINSCSDKDCVKTLNRQQRIFGGGASERSSRPFQVSVVNIRKKINDFITRISSRPVVGAQGMTVNATGCSVDNFYFFALVSKQSAALSFATQQTMPPEFGGNWNW